VTGIVKHIVNFIAFSELILNLTKRQIKARFKQSAPGFMWIVVKPMVKAFAAIHSTTDRKPKKYVAFFPCGGQRRLIA
jgi:ABC-type polysaccharide/polyol phosphate export permease